MFQEVFAANADELDQAIAWRGLDELPPAPPPKKKWWSRAETPTPHGELGRLDVPRVEVGAVMDVELATLEALLYGEPPLDDVDALLDLMENPVFGEPPDAYEVFISPVSNRLVAALLDSSEERLRAVVADWVKTEEMQRSRWTESDALDAAQAIADICNKARDSKRDVFRYFSL